jgi:hypothetical protein
VHRQRLPEVENSVLGRPFATSPIAVPDAPGSREMIGGATRSSWHLHMTVPARDLTLLIPALKVWLEDLDEQPRPP